MGHVMRKLPLQQRHGHMRSEDSEAKGISRVAVAHYGVQGLQDLRSRDLKFRLEICLLFGPLTAPSRWR